ncbi:MAG TPA: hypothetical protein VKY74_02490 [Chloroflexia bacterium]|nr:hypothetical protein [Chloroflexia bacterium]
MVSVREAVGGEARPFPWWAVAGWAAAVAVGLAVTALGHFPALSVYYFGGLSPGDYRADWPLYGRALAFTVLGGLIIGLIQWRILAALGETLTFKRWLGIPLVWLMGWAMVIFMHGFTLQGQLGRIDYDRRELLPELALIGWFYPALMQIILQRDLRARRDHPFVALLTLSGWAVGGLVYWWLLDRFGNGFTSTILLALPAGAVVGGLIGLGWRYEARFSAGAGRLAARIIGPPIDDLPVWPGINPRPLLVDWTLAGLLGWLITMGPALWAMYGIKPQWHGSAAVSYAATVGLAGAVLAGAVAGRIQAAALRRLGDPAARGWAIITLVAWVGQWLLAVLLPVALVDHYQPPTGDAVGFIAWIAGGLVFALIQSAALRRPGWRGAWGVLAAISILTALLYLILFPTTAAGWQAGLLATALVGAGGGVGAGLLLYYVLVTPEPQVEPSAFPGPLKAEPWIAGGAGLAGAGILLALASQLCVDSHCRATIPPGPAVHWAEQLRVAQEAAATMEPEAILIAVTAQPRATAGAAPDQVPVIVAFHFYSPAGRAAEGQYSGWGDMTVGFADTDLQGTLRINRDDQRIEDYGATGHSNAQAALPLVQIGPREALARARAARQGALAGAGPASDATAEARLLLAVPMGSLSSDQALRRVWRVQYDNPAMEFGVDAATGEVMRLDKPASLH